MNKSPQRLVKEKKKILKQSSSAKTSLEGRLHTRKKSICKKSYMTYREKWQTNKSYEHKMAEVIIKSDHPKKRNTDVQIK